MRHLDHGISRTSRVSGRDGKLHHDRISEPVDIYRPFADTTGNWAYEFDGVLHGGHTSYYAAEAEATGFIRGLLAHLDGERATHDGTLLNGGIIGDRNRYTLAGRNIDVTVVEHQSAWGYSSDGIWRGPFDNQRDADTEALGFTRALMYLDGHRGGAAPSTNTWLTLHLRHG